MKALNLDLVRATSASRLSLRALAWASIIAPGALFGAYALVSYGAAFRSAESRAAHLSSILQEHAQRTFEAVGLALANADHRLAGLDDETIRTSRSLWQEVRRIQATGPQLGSIFVIAADGSVPLTTREFPPPQVNFSDRDYFLAHKDQDGQFFLGHAYQGRISGIPVFNFSIRRSSKDGGFNGVIGSSAYVNYFQDFYATVGDPDDDFAVILLRSDGEVLARYPSITAAGDKVDPRVLRIGDGAARQVSYARSPVDGANRLFASARIGTFPAYIAYSITRNAILQKWAKNLVLPGAVAVATACILLLLSSFAMRRAAREGMAVARLKDTADALTFEVDRRRRAEASLLQAQKLDAVGRLTGGVAHDFNNLLMIIAGNLALAEKRDDLAAIRRFLKTAQVAVDRGATLTRHLLAFSRGQNLRPVVVDLNDVLANAKSWIGRAVTEAVEIQFEREANLWPVRIDIHQFEAALLNLVVNARDAIGGQGRLIVRARNVFLQQNDPRVPSLPAGEYVALSVTDNGSGMPADVLAKVYEPFFTTKDVGKGTGLGLSQVHGFIRQSGGDISIHSEVGQGTTVTLYFSRSHLPAEGTIQPGATAPLPSVELEKVVLVVEDDDQVRKVSLTMLHELGYCALAARTGQEALAILSAGERIDVLFTDLVLARGLGGEVLAAKALELKPELSVLLTTALLESASPFPILQKPFTKETLAKAIHDASNHAAREKSRSH
jgi:two-component system NtrC family sensor kinase